MSVQVLVAERNIAINMIQYNTMQYNTISYQLFWSVIQLISRNQRTVSPEAQPRVIQPSDCEI